MTSRSGTARAGNDPGVRDSCTRPLGPGPRGLRAAVAGASVPQSRWSGLRAVGRAEPLQPREALHRIRGQGALGDLPHVRADGNQYIRLLRFHGVLPIGAQGGAPAQRCPGRPSVSFATPTQRRRWRLRRWRDRGHAGNSERRAARISTPLASEQRLTRRRPSRADSARTAPPTAPRQPSP